MRPRIEDSTPAFLPLQCQPHHYKNSANDLIADTSSKRITRIENFIMYSIKSVFLAHSPVYDAWWCQVRIAPHRRLTNQLSSSNIQCMRNIPYHFFFFLEAFASFLASLAAFSASRRIGLWLSSSSCLLTSKVILSRRMCSPW